MPDMTWVAAVARLRERREPGVLVTVASVRGHPPRRAGAKLVVGATGTWGAIGVGNIETAAIDRARELIGTLAPASAPTPEPELMDFALNDKVTNRHGVQCCGVGHVGLEPARILARHNLDLHLVDTRAGVLTEERLGVLAAAPIPVPARAPASASASAPTRSTHDRQYPGAGLRESERAWMDRAIELATASATSGGGPFGALIVKDGRVVADAHNQVTANLDPSAHAEVNAIRAACQVLGTFALDGCTLITSCEPCPMCLATWVAKSDRVDY